MKRSLILFLLCFSLQAAELAPVKFAKKMDKQILHGGFEGIMVPWKCAVGKNDNEDYLPEEMNLKVTMNRLGSVGIKPDIFKSNATLGNFLNSIFKKKRTLPKVDYSECTQTFLQNFQEAITEYRQQRCPEARETNPVCKTTDDKLMDKAQRRISKSSLVKEFLKTEPPKDTLAHDADFGDQTYVPVPPRSTQSELEDIAQTANRISAGGFREVSVEDCPEDAKPGKLVARSCPRTTPRGKPRSMEELLPILEENNIKLATPITDTANIEQFLVEFYKFPASLREALKNKLKIHLIEGESVMDDRLSKPRAETSKLKATNREAVDLPGTGGNSTNPTRIVINKLYQNHGSKNLFIHEHSHAVDALLGRPSRKESWRRVFNDPKHAEFLKMICPTANYCLNNSDEAFAESLAYYTSCANTRQHMQQAVPELARYFEELIAKPR